MNLKTYKIFLAFHLLFFYWFTAGVSNAQALNSLYEIRNWTSPTFTRVVLDLKKEADYDYFVLKNPDRIVLDLKGADGKVPRKRIDVNDGIVKTIRATENRKGVIRVVVDLEKKSRYTVFPLKAIEGKSPRLVIDVNRPDLEKALQTKREETRQLKQKYDYVVVVVDPGHGGEDPGAVSRNKTMEKDIVLSIAKRLQSELNRRKGIKAYLTRTGDYFISLEKRIEIAKQYGADIFISIHADSSFSSSVRGSSVYCLSFAGASSNTAKLAAKKENISNLIGGVPIEKQDSALNSIILDLVQTSSINSSLQLAGRTLQEMSKFNRLHTSSPQQANFAVLRAPDIPSILVEVDFISNTQSESNMKTASFQQKVATHITSAVEGFIPSLNMERRSTRFHVVKKGDTLFSIARKNNTTVETLRQLNNMNEKSVLKAGEKIRVF